MRLVAKGFYQRPGIDFSETYSLVVKPTTIRIILSLAVNFGWELRQLDVNNAFLQGNLTKKVFMQQPPDFRDAKYPHYVCLLRKAIYGMRQAPREWYKALHSFLVQHKFHNSICDSSLFIHHHGSTIIYLLVYVDDIIITDNHPPTTSQFIQSLSSHFSLKDLGLLRCFLGMEVHYTSQSLFLSQQKYITDIRSKTHMLDANAVSTPLQKKI